MKSLFKDGRVAAMTSSPGHERAAAGDQAGQKQSFRPGCGDGLGCGRGTHHLFNP
jgi:hypothetical protein